VPNAGIVSDANLLDDVLRFSPNRDALLWFDAKLATTFVPDAALVHLDFVGQRARSFHGAEIGVVCHGLAAGTCLRPSRPLLGGSPSVSPFAFFKKMVQGGVRVLYGEEEVWS
tara:strand:+ start:648 stop:986 length:339 start_codon:yes stop_codon:yes gene_type:complete